MQIFADYETNLIGQIKVGCNFINIVFDGNKHSSFLNGSKILEANSKSEFLNSIPIVSLINSSLCDESEHEVNLYFKKAETYSGMMGDLSNELSKSDKIKKVVLKRKPSEHEYNKPVQAKKWASLGLREYQRNLKSFSENMESSRSMSSILLKTQFPQTMWGGKEVTEVLSNIGKEKNAVDLLMENFDGAIERSDRMINGVALMAKKGSKIYSTPTEAVRLIVQDFFLIKEILFKMSQALYGLYNIDSVFKKYTGYPTTWFFNSSIFYDFLYSFDNMIKDLVKTSVAEKIAIRYPSFRLIHGLYVISKLG